VFFGLLRNQPLKFISLDAIRQSLSLFYGRARALNEYALAVILELFNRFKDIG
jgi:hypothetical protein